MGKNDDRKHVHDLAVFALEMLRILEEDCHNSGHRKLYALARDHGFAKGERWKRTERGTQFSDTWYGSSSDAEEAPRVGDHIERDLH